MLELKRTENIGYKFIMHCAVTNGANEDLIVVLGEHEDGRFVTWLTMDGENFDLGHYFAKGQRLKAMEDMFQRAEKWDIDFAYKMTKTPRQMLRDEGYFGIVMWNDDDLKEALDRKGYPDTEHNLDLLRTECECGTGIHGFMIERGWDFIYETIGLLENSDEYKLEEFEEE